MLPCRSCRTRQYEVVALFFVSLLIVSVPETLGRRKMIKTAGRAGPSDGIGSSVVTEAIVVAAAPAVSVNAWATSVVEESTSTAAKVSVPAVVEANTSTSAVVEEIASAPALGEVNTSVMAFAAADAAGVALTVPVVAANASALAEVEDSNASSPRLDTLGLVEATRELTRRFSMGADIQCIQNLGDTMGCSADCPCGFGKRCYPRYALIEGEGSGPGDAARFDVGVCDVDMRLPLVSGFFFFSVFFLGQLIYLRKKYPLTRKEFIQSTTWHEVNILAAAPEPLGSATAEGVAESAAGLQWDGASSSMSAPVTSAYAEPVPLPVPVPFPVHFSPLRAAEAGAPVPALAPAPVPFPKEEPMPRQPFPKSPLATICSGAAAAVEGNASASSAPSGGASLASVVT